MKKWKGVLQLGFIGLVLALTAYVALLWIERQALKDLEQKEVVRCIKVCPAGVDITHENVSEYFETTNVAAMLATEQTINEIQQLIGTYPQRTIEKGEIVYTPVLTAADKIEELVNPVEISVTAGIEYAVAGRIRKGDTVNVYVEDADTEEFELILEKVIVQEAFDSNATVISMSNEHALASMFTFYVETSMAENLGELYNGKFANVKIK